MSKLGQPLEPARVLIIRNLFPWPFTQRVRLSLGPTNLYFSKFSSDSIVLEQILFSYLILVEGPVFSI